MVVTVSNRYIVAYKSKKEYVAMESDITSLEDIYSTSDKDVYFFYVSGYNYKAKQQSAYIQCVQLFGMLRKYYYTNNTLFLIVGWIQAKASQFGLITRLRKEGYYD